MPQKQPNRPGATKRPPPPAKPPDGCAMATPIRQPIHVDTLYDYRLMLADGRPVLGVIGGGHERPFTAQEKVAIAAHAVACWNTAAAMADTKIKLPALPEDFRMKGPRKITAAQLRARDLEVVRVVLEAAAEVAQRFAGEQPAAVIRALEVSHG